jgi:cation diffusion facilitator CzcD-associated flavoprotein CzcO
VLTTVGIYGLVMAKTHLEVHPNARLLVLDPGKSVGGTWAHERLYDELRTNNVVGSFEFHDFPMDFETYGVPPGSHVPGNVVHRYLTAYAQHFGVFNCVRFGAWVKSAELQGNGEWLILYDLKKAEELVRSMKVIAKKMVLATGSTSEPNMPSIAGSETFGGHIFHFKELPKRKEEMNDAKNVVVLGGSKAAADTVYLNASKGKHVDWIVRSEWRDFTA